VVEAVLILVALAVAGLVLARGFGGDSDAGRSLPTGAVPLPRILPQHIFTGPPARVHHQALPPPGGDEYTLALSRQPGGRWASVLHGPTVTMEGGALTVTVVVPWSELVDHFTAVNLVVR
jgi:hypothetical protein